MPASTPFPTLSAALDDWRWPAPPFSWPHEPPAAEGAQPCLIETRHGSAVEGYLLNVDPYAGLISFRIGPTGAPVQLPFARFCRLTLTEPLAPVGRRQNALPEHAPVAAEERSYTLQRESRAPMEGRTLGYVQSTEMLLLWPPADGGRTVLRVLVPRSAYRSAAFGETVAETASRRWIATPEQLLAALAQRKPVLQTGQALLELGFVTPDQLQAAMNQPADGQPLGERLVHSGVLARANLHTALAYKLGMPLVDISRFPLNAATVQKLPRKLAISARALPLLEDGQRLIVAVDRPGRIEKLSQARSFAQMSIEPVLAAKSHILLALARLSQRDVWADHVVGLPGYFATTT